MDELRQSPFVESLVDRGFEVIYFMDPLDEYMMQASQALCIFCSAAARHKHARAAVSGLRGVPGIGQQSISGRRRAVVEVV